MKRNNIDLLIISMLKEYDKKGVYYTFQIEKMKGYWLYYIFFKNHFTLNILNQPYGWNIHFSIYKQKKVK